MSQYDIRGFINDIGLDVNDTVEIFQTYIGDLDMFAKQLITEIGKGDALALERVVHALKGSSGNLQVNNIYEESSVFDRKLKSGDLSGAKEHVENLIERMKAVKADIKEFFKEYGIEL